MISSMQYNSYIYIYITNNKFICIEPYSFKIVTASLEWRIKSTWINGMSQKKRTINLYIQMSLQLKQL